MLSVTTSALQHLHNAMDEPDASDTCFRMVAQEDQTVGLRVQPPAAGDRTFEYKGATVLAIPEILHEPLSAKTLDVDEQGELVLLPKPS